MTPMHDYQVDLIRRCFLGRLGLGLGALATLLPSDGRAEVADRRDDVGGLDGLPHRAPAARRVIYLFQSGGPSQIDLLDHKPGFTQAVRRGKFRNRCIRMIGKRR